MKKKIVWICHFTDNEIQSIIKPYIMMKESALWISMLLKVFEDRDDIDLHVVSPHQYITGTKSFTRRGIKFYFFNAFMPVIGRHWPNFFRWDLWTDFRHNKLVIRKLVDRIRPDLIHLHGFENAYYSSSIFQFKHKYPVFITVQGFVSHLVGPRNDIKSYRVDIEQRIMTEFRHFGYRTKQMGEDVLSFNPNAVLHWHRYNIIFKEYSATKKLYDIVIFAAHPQAKGLMDIVVALGSIKQTSEADYSLLVIGNIDQGSLRSVREEAQAQRILQNIRFLGYLQTQDEVHKRVSEAKICVLPTKSDIIPGTIIESMSLGLPVISYEVGSIGEINDDDEYIVLLPVNDTIGLAREIQSLLTDESRQATLARKAKMRLNRLIDNESVFPDLMKGYQETIDSFQVEKKL